MQIDRRAFLATLGSAAVIEAMPSEAKAEALEHYLMAQLDKPVTPPAAPLAAQPPAVRRGAGILFGGPSPSGRYPELAALAPMPERPTLVEPGTVHEYTVRLWETSQLFRAGHRIRLEVSSSNFPHYDRNPNTGHPFGVDAELRPAGQTVYHGPERPSHVVLPIIPKPIEG